MKTVTGGVGTIKRKRELRELLEQQDVDYEDDIFDSTPFKRKKDLKVRRPSLSKPNVFNNDIPTRKEFSR